MSEDAAPAKSQRGGLTTYTTWSLTALVVSTLAFVVPLLFILATARGENGMIWGGILFITGLPVAITSSLVGLIVVIIGRIRHGASRLQMTCIALHVLLLAWTAAIAIPILTE